jgi:hypothetical protein
MANEEVVQVVERAHGWAAHITTAAASAKNKTAHGLMAGLGRFLLKFIRFAFVIL